MKSLYCNSLTKYERLKTIEVAIGNIPLGGTNPIRIQSMTNTLTKDIEATVAQTIRIFDAGADYVRITTPTPKDAEALEAIKAELNAKGYHKPLVADVHFNPRAAETAARLIEKVRVNPGNFVDSKRFQHVEFTEVAYAQELAKIEEKLLVLINICKEKGTSLRIGTNHGSLSDRIMSRYGDTPDGMVEATMEFLRICVKHHFYRAVVSLKSSNTRIMVQAYRLLVYKMSLEGMSFPLHLGVTEAGEGEDGRIKSAVGMGTLLADGLGSTIRVSLTEDPEAEIPVAQALANYFSGRENHDAIEPVETDSLWFKPFEYNRRQTGFVDEIGGVNAPVVITDFRKVNAHKAALMQLFKFRDGRYSKTERSPEYLYLGSEEFELEHKIETAFIYDFDNRSIKPNHFPLVSFEERSALDASAFRKVFIEITYKQLNDVAIAYFAEHKNAVPVLLTENLNGVAEQRAFFLKLMAKSIDTPVVVKRTYAESANELLQLKSAADFGALFLDGYGDGIWLDNLGESQPNKLNDIAFGILQAARVRVSKTEFISCPSCGRTLFDLQETSAKVRSKTEHLKGLKIAVMGCIVNGPGEMADADYGYVGAGKGKITLYKGKEVVEKNLPAEHAVDTLVALIKSNNDWIEKED